MQKITKFCGLFLLLVSSISQLIAQELESEDDSSTTDNSFGFDGENSAKGDIEVKVGGEIDFAALQFLGDLDAILERETIVKANGVLRIDAQGASVDAILKLRVNPDIIASDPARVLDEGRLRLHLASGSFIEGGIMDLSWGKADSLRVLDVLNAQDLSDLSLSKAADQKISQAMLHLQLGLSDSVSLEAVWLPFFTATKTAWDGPWVAKKVQDLKSLGYSMLYQGQDPSINDGRGNGYYNAYYQSAWSTAYSAALNVYITGGANLTDANIAATNAANAAVTANAPMIAAQAEASAQAALPNLLAYPDTKTLDYTQLGARLNASVEGVDFGVQYFWGYLGLPAVVADPASLNLSSGIPVSYNRYHHFGADLATVIAGFNTRVEIAVNLTDDFNGDKIGVYNPAFVWAAGFDRELFAGISANVQAKGSITLNHQGITNPLDIEYGSTVSKTMIALRLNQKLARDTFEWEITGLYAVENIDFAIIPAITIYIGDAALKVSGRIFGGNVQGDLGQYWRNTYLDIALSYTF